MSNVDVKQISDATGSFSTLKMPAESAVAGGKFAPETGKKAPVTEKVEPDLKALAAELNVSSQSIGRDLRFKVDMNSGRSVIQVLDRDTGEIIREIPPEKARISVAANGGMQLRLYDGLA